MFRRLAAALVITALCGLPLKAQTTASPQPFLNAAVTTTVNVKTLPTSLYAFVLADPAATTVCYLQIFNATAANVTLGTTVPLLSIPVNVASATVPGITALSFPPVQFNVAMSIAATTAPTGGTPCGTAMVVNLLFL